MYAWVKVNVSGSWPTMHWKRETSQVLSGSTYDTG